MTAATALGHSAVMDDARSSRAVHVDVLGPLALRVDGEPVDVPGFRRRALLAVLALAGSRVVSAERLVDELWPDDPPLKADQALYNHVSRLRAHLRPYGDRLVRQGAGYLLRLEDGELDSDLARRGTDPAAALALWRGAALEEFRGLPALEVEAVALEELRLRLVDDVLEARLAAGDRSVAVQAAAAAAAAPLRERSILLHVRALAAEGRTAEAMAAAQSYRRRLAEETGLDAGPELAALEQRVASGAAGDAGPAAPVRRTVARPDGPLLGRDRDRDEALRLLTTHATVTLAGPGGVGKTRLALDVAAELSATEEGDVVLVDLAAVDRADRVCPAVASTLGLRVAGPVGPAEIGAALADRRLLLVLDNCEHVVAACRDLVATLRLLAPRLRVLATSRVTLDVPGEYVLRLQPLPVPREFVGGDALRRQPAVRAFVEHARRRVPGFELADDDATDLLDVLRRIDGLPLGIELAARQVSVMPLHAVRERLDRALDLATGRGGLDHDRQRTLRATIASTYRLLAEAEQALLRALAPFPGGVALDMVEALAPAGQDPLDLLHRLVDTSLVSAEPSKGRFRLLFTVRDFLLDELRGRGELRAAETVFLERCLALAEELGEAALGPAEVEADRRIRTELDNLRAAWDVAKAHGRIDVRVRTTIALGEVATWRDLREVWTWALELADDPDLVECPDRAVVLGCAAEAARLLGDLDRAAALADAALRAAGPEPDPEQAYRAWSVLGSVAHFRGDFDEARDHWTRAADGRSRTSGPWVASAALAATYGGDRESARSLLARTHAANEISSCPSHRAFAAYVEAEVCAVDRVEEAVPHYVSAIEEARACGAVFVEGVASVGLASAQARIGDVRAAAAAFAGLLASWRQTGHATQLWTTARNAAAVLAETGRTHTAALLVICADQQPGAAAVTPAIARHSGRVFVDLADLVTPDEVPALQAAVARMGSGGVLDTARADLLALSAGGVSGASRTLGT